MIVGALIPLVATPHAEPTVAVTVCHLCVEAAVWLDRVSWLGPAEADPVRERSRSLGGVATTADGQPVANGYGRISQRDDEVGRRAPLQSGP